jgi:hypothetical protein
MDKIDLQDRATLLIKLFMNIRISDKANFFLFVLMNFISRSEEDWILVSVIALVLALLLRFSLPTSYSFLENNTSGGGIGSIRAIGLDIYINNTHVYGNNHRLVHLFFQWHVAENESFYECVSLNTFRNHEMRI